jgi:hypothetical protein
MIGVLMVGEKCAELLSAASEERGLAR